MEVTVTKISGSLVVQWLRVRASNAEHQGSIPGQGTRSHMLQLRPSTVNFFFFNNKDAGIRTRQSTWPNWRERER